MNQSYRSIFVSRAAGALGAARAVASVSHSGVKGAIREVLLRELFRPLLPGDVGVGTGQIANAAGDLSAQQDVVIYDRRILPPVLFENVLGIFPVESVLATVEVKTTLNAAEITSAYASASALKMFSYQSGESDRVTGRSTVHAIEKSISAVFALDSDLTGSGKSELQRYLETDASVDPCVRSICVSGCGYWYFSNKWEHVKPDGEHAETVAFIVGLYDALGGVAESRRHDWRGTCCNQARASV